MILVGNSMGGMLSILATGERPEAVTGLVLLDPAIPGPRRALDPLVALMFAIYAVPFLGERFLRCRRTRQPSSPGCGRCSRSAASTRTPSRRR